jgi:predicted ThiF/HesA family dinucleotide-utilizing enzyme
MTFEEEIKQKVKDYGAPDHITEEIEKFLFDSNYLETIVEIFKKHLSETIRRMTDEF